jgi:DHA2 family multidrug resistance protein
MLTTKQTPFVSPGLFKDRNYLTGNVFIFILGVVMYATLALVPSMMQDLFNYPVVTTGLVTAPRGIGTLAAMVVVGWMMRKMDIRLVIATGFVISAVSLWQMTGFYLQMDDAGVISSGFLQGLGSGIAYVPMSTATFATLPAVFRNEGAAFFSLVRNLGSSIGITTVTTLLTRNTQMMHARLAEHVTPYSEALRSQSSAILSGAHGLNALNASVTSQAAMIAYNNDFKLMMVLSLCAIPLVLLVRGARAAPSDEPVVIE